MNVMKLNLGVAWMSIFALSWLILLKVVPVDTKSILFFLFFVFVALYCEGSIQQEKKNG